MTDENDFREEHFRLELERLKTDVCLRKRLFEISRHAYWKWTGVVIIAMAACTVAALLLLAVNLSDSSSREEPVEVIVTHRIETGYTLSSGDIQAIAEVADSIIDFWGMGANPSPALRALAEDFASSFVKQAGTNLADGTANAVSGLLADLKAFLRRDSESALAVLYFDLDSAQLPRSAVSKIKTLCTLVVDSGLPGISFMGYADRVGVEAWNVDLAARRAIAARNKFQDSCKNFEGAIRYVGMGEGTSGTDLKDGESDPEDRKVVVQIFDP